jgi:hypothetical protein
MGDLKVDGRITLKCILRKYIWGCGVDSCGSIGVL